jgi:hypothetical protein
MTPVIPLGWARSNPERATASRSNSIVVTPPRTLHRSLVVEVDADSFGTIDVLTILCEGRCAESTLTPTAANQRAIAESNKADPIVSVRIFNSSGWFGEPRANCPPWLRDRWTLTRRAL